MTEDISSMMRLAVTLTLAAVVITSAIFMNMVITPNLYKFTDKYVDTVNSTNTTFIADLSRKDKIGAPTVYKTLYRLESYTKIESITFKDGTSTTDLKELLNRPDASVNVKIVDEGNIYKITIKEV